jgi:phospholipid transport system substrate-binding protein
MMRFLTAVLGLFLLAQPAFAASPALESVKTTADAVLATLRDPKYQSDRAQRQEQIKNLIRARFDFEEMSKRALGPNWPNQSPANQQQFVQRFTDLLLNTYIDRLDDYKGVRISYDGERRDGDTATVNTKVLDPKGQQYSLNYRLRAANGDWKIYDVVVEDISLVNNYRSQFNRMLSKESFSDLLQKLSSKQFSGTGGSS